MLRHSILKRKPSRINSSRTDRRLGVEPLEDRRVLSIDFASAFAIGSSAIETVYDLSLDGAGDTCVVGRFAGTVDFDPGPGTYELTSTPPGTGNTFAAKYDPSGNLLWARRIGGAAANFAPEIAGGSDGSVYVVGSFTGRADFGPTTLTSEGGNDAYAAKLDSDGNFVWAKRYGGANDDYGNGVAIDAIGNAYIMAETRTVSAGSPDAYMAKVDAGGNVVWTAVVGASSSIPTKGKPGPTGWARGFKITVDTTGDIYATGRMSGTVDFDPGAGTTSVAGSAFVAKYTANGNIVWARAFTGGLVLEPHDIAVDSSGNVYSTGSLVLSADFDPGTNKKTQKFILDAGTADDGSWNTAGYVSALDASGNFLWAKSTQMVGGAFYQARANAIALDSLGGIYIAGDFFSGTADFDPGAGTFSLTPIGNDAFVWKLDTSGNFVTALQIGGAGDDGAAGIDVDAAGNIYTAGYFSGTVDFDPGASTFNLTSASADAFVLKLTQSGALAAAGAGASTSLSELRLATNTIEGATVSDPAPTNSRVLLSVAAEPRKSQGSSAASSIQADAPRSAAADRALANWHGTANRHNANGFDSLDDDLLDTLVVGTSLHLLLV
jgi:Beta-propeller repeat/Planctomycete extracellular